MKNPKTILITGASSGLGAALALEYAAPSVILFLSGRNKSRLEQVAVKCRERGAEVQTALIDVQDKISMSNWVKSICEETNLDLIVANAGISTAAAESADMENQVRQVFAVNLLGVLNTILPAIPFMVRNRQGQIIIMSSLAGYVGLPSCPAYSASKAAVKNYGEALRARLRSNNVGVTVVTPGFIRTPLTEANKFFMPMIMDAHKAATIIKEKLINNPARIAFPWGLYMLIRLFGLLPASMSAAILAKLNQDNHNKN